MPDGFQRVRRFAGLRNRDDQRVAVENRVAVAELAGQLDLDRQAAPVLDGVLGDQPRVVGRATSDDEDLVDVAQVLVGDALLVEDDPAGLEVAPQRVGQRLGLLLDLLEHEVLVAALLGGGEIPVDRERLRLGGIAVEIGDLVAVAGDHDELVLAEFDGLAGVLDERRHIRRDERLAFADADDQRRGASGGDDGVRVVGVGHDQGERTFETTADGSHAGREVARGVAVHIGAGDEVSGGLGVGVAGHLDAFGLELVPQGGEVLDDPVVHDRDALRGVAVRVRVAVDRSAMGGPAGVPHARGAAEVLAPDLVELGLEVGEAACFALDVQRAGPVEDRDTGRVVAAVLHAPEPAEDDVQSRAVPDISNDSTHADQPNEGPPAG